MSIEQYAEEAHRAVVDMAQAFHLKATTRDGLPLSVPCSYQILEPGFRPFRAGKASPEELQGELDEMLAQAEVRNIDPGIEGQESIRKLSLQLGLGIDCSNFAFRSLALLHERLGLPAYTDHVHRSTSEIADLNATKDSWTAKDAHGHPRSLTEQETTQLAGQEHVSASWIVSVFGKDPEFIIGSKHITAETAVIPVTAPNVLPGDVIAFQKSGNGAVSHLAIAESIEHGDEETVHIDFWHSWHTRDFASGLRRDSVIVDGSSLTWSHEGLADTTRYSGHYFCRPIGMAALSGIEL